MAGDKAKIAKQARPVLSLFSGAGGFDLGFRTAGFEPRLAIDIAPAAVETYRHNHPGTAVEKLDLSSAAASDLERLWRHHAGAEEPVGIIGGPPCQAFSVSNVHQKKRDGRRTLLFKYVETIEHFSKLCQLDFFVFENVPVLVQARHSWRFQEFRRRCERAGFRVSYKVVDAGNFGIPQHRRRLIIVGTSRLRFPNLDFDPPDGDSTPPNSATVLKGLPEPAYCSRMPHEQRASPFHPNHVTMVPRSPKFTNGKLEPADARGRSFRVLSWDMPSYTVAYGHREIHIHPDRHRRLSVYEAMLLQGFPKSYELKGTFSQQVQLVSDALPPPLSEGIARAISVALGYEPVDAANAETCRGAKTSAE